MGKQLSPEDLRAAFARYAQGRAELLEAIGISASNRDPLSEFSERVVAALLGGDLAKSRVQRGWDVVAGERNVQVKYLANPADHWVNEHHVQFTNEMNDYAIVFFEALLPVAVIVFPRDGLSAIGAALGKKHPNQKTTLQLTRMNYHRLLRERKKFAPLGVRIFDLRDVVPPAVSAGSGNDP